MGSNWKPTIVPTSGLKKKRRNPPSRQRRSAQRLALFLVKKKQSDSGASSASVIPAAYDGNPSAAASFPFDSPASGFPVSGSDDAGKAEDTQVLVASSLALEMSGS